MRFCLWTTVLLSSAMSLKGQCTILAFDAKSSVPPKQVKNETIGPKCAKLSNAFLREKNTELHVNGRRFGDVFSVQIDKLVSVGTGIIEIRGLSPEEIKPIEENTGGVPVSRGVNVASEVQIDEIKRGEIIAELLNERTLGATRTKLNAQLKSLELAKRGLDREIEDLERRIGEILGYQVSKQAGASRDLLTLLEAIQEERARFPGDTQNELDFAARVRRVDRIALDYRQMQARLAGLSFKAELDALFAQTQAFKRKLDQFDQNVRSAKLAGEFVVNLIAKSKALVEQARALDLRKEIADRLKVTGAGNVNDAELNNLMELFIKSQANEATAVMSAEARTLLPGRMAPAAPDTSKTEDTYRNLQANIKVVNSAFADMLNETNKLWQDSKAPTQVIPVSVEQSGNLRVYYSVWKQETFAPYRMGSADTRSLGTIAQGGGLGPSSASNTMAAAGASAASGGAAGTASSVPAAAAQQPAAAAGDAQDKPKVRVANGSVEIHKFWRAALVAGFGFSSLRDETFELQTCSTDPAKSCVVRGSSQRPQIGYVVGVHYYLRERDSFPGALTTRQRWTPGIFGGTAMTKLNQYYLGLGFEPTLGVQLATGYQFGSVSRLKDNVSLSLPVPSSVRAASDAIRSKGANGFFVMTGFDFKIFGKVFGSAKVVGSTP